MALGWKKDYLRYKGFFLNILSIYNSKPSLKIYLELFLSLGTVLIFAIFAIKPTVLTILELNKEIQSKKNTVSKLEQKIVSLKTASNLLQNESLNLQLIENAVPGSADVEQFINQLEKLALSHSVVISGFSSSDAIIKGDLNKKKNSDNLTPLPNNANELVVSFSVTGTYQGLYELLQSIENLRRPVKFDSFVFNSSNTADNEKIIILTVSGRLPFLVINENQTI